MNWWIEDPTRARQEKEALAQLEQENDWLVFGAWELESGLGLSLQINISVADQKFPLKLVFPSYFPDIPAQIFHRDEKRISSHQYGAKGELCLEYRPDNWLREYSAALMVQSAYDLLKSEIPEDAGPVSEVPDAHVDTLAQKIRSSKCRFLLRSEERELIEGLDDHSVTAIRTAEHHYNRHFIASIRSIGRDGDDDFKNTHKVSRANISKGCILKLPSVAGLKAADVRDLLEKSLLANQDCQEDFSNTAGEFFVCCADGKEAKLFSIPKGNKEGKVFVYKTAELPKVQKRLDAKFDILAEKKVGIVGCGSLGSKIAISLARSGILEFVLVDGDILFQENLVRNDLNIEAVGLHKSDALEQAIQNINPNANCIVRRTLLGGQESAESVQVTLSWLEKCDLLIDATAEAEVFNYLVGVAQRKTIPLLWGEIFGGGFGGLAARSRPHKEPTPDRVRDAIADFCGKHPMEKTDDVSKYETTTMDGQALIASDADVGLIANHLVQFTIDCLANAGDSRFPSAAYLIGFKKHWIFEAPFDVYPLDIHSDDSWNAPGIEENKDELLRFMGEIFPRKEAGDES